MPLYLTEDDVVSLVSPADAVEAVDACLRRIAAGEVDEIARAQAALEDGAFALMGAVDRGLRIAGAKTYAWLPGGTTFVVVLFDLEAAATLAVIEADALGRLRTGAAGAVAARHLARPGATTLGVIGCGRQARSHVAAVRAALPGIERVVAHCRTRAELERFCAETGAEPVDAAREAAGQDVVVTATTSRDPVLRGDWLRPGALVVGVGANDPAARELDNEVIRRASFVCTDSREQARREAGDLVEPIAQGVLDWLEVHELHEVVAGEVEGRHDDADVVLFKSNGVAAWDVALGARAVELARERGVGREL